MLEENRIMEERSNIKTDPLGLRTHPIPRRRRRRRRESVRNPYNEERIQRVPWRQLFLDCTSCTEKDKEVDDRNLLLQILTSPPSSPIDPFLPGSSESSDPFDAARIGDVPFTMREASKESTTSVGRANCASPGTAGNSTYYEALLLGRSPVSGVVDASTLAGLVRTLLMLRPVQNSSASSHQRGTQTPSSATPSYLLRIGSRGLHVHSSKHRDEGFESDTDSTRSGGEERLASGGAGSPAGDEASSSANSSASSDAEDPESPTVGTFPYRQRRRRRKEDSTDSVATEEYEDDERVGGCDDELGELYTVSDVAFCHADPAFPRVAVWVVKRGQRQHQQQANGLGRKTAAASSSGLEALVFECKNEESARKLVDSYTELSRRVKLEQFKNLRRKETGNTPSRGAFTLGRRPDIAAESPGRLGKYNLVQRVDGDGVTHIEVAGLTRKGINSSSPSESEPSSIISISTPDVGDILNSHSTAPNPKSRLLREIEGVIIRSDPIEQNGAVRKEPTSRQRQPAILVAAPIDINKSGSVSKDLELRKVWRSDTSKDGYNQSDSPPQRPERRRYLRKNKNGTLEEADQSQSQMQQSGDRSALMTSQGSGHSSKNGVSDTTGRVVRGQYIRVSVDRPAVTLPIAQTPPPPPPSQYNWVLLNIGDYNNNSTTSGNSVMSNSLGSSSTSSVFSAATWSGNKSKQRSMSRDRSTGPLSSSTTFAQQQQWDEAVRRRRSRSKSPPRTRPMAHRYIDVASSSLRLGAQSKRWGGEYGGSVWGSSGTLSFVNDDDHHRLTVASSPSNTSCLKSVIKKNKRFGECSEPKKVTFSAFATVQVVD